MDRVEIKYIDERTIEIIGELDIDMKAEQIHIGCYSDDDEIRDYKEEAHIELNISMDFLLKELPELFKWTTDNTQRRTLEIETNPSFSEEDEFIKCGAKWIIKPNKYVHLPYDSNWKMTLERLD